MSNIKEFWKEVNKTDIPEEYRILIKTLSLWMDKKHNAEMTKCYKKIETLEKKLQKLQKLQDKNKKPKPKKAKIVKQNSGTLIVAEYKNGFLIHGSGAFVCKEKLKEVCDYFSKIYSGWIIERKLSLDEKHKLIEQLQTEVAKIMPINKTNLELEFRKTRDY